MLPSRKRDLALRYCRKAHTSRRMIISIWNSLELLKVKPDSHGKRNYKEYRTTSFWTEERADIVFFKYAPKLEINIEVAKEIVESRLHYTQGESVYTLIDFSNVKSVTKEARDYMNSPDGGLKGLL